MEQPLGVKVLPPTVPGFLHSALAASEVGVWEYRSSTGLTYGDMTFARLYGLDPADATAGVSTDRVIACLHPDDRQIGVEKRQEMRELGGAFVFEHRTVPAPGEVRRLFVRGRYEVSTTGLYQGGRGIIIDITEGKHNEVDDWPSYLTSDIQFARETALEKAARHTIAARRAIDEIEHDGRQQLLPLVNALLTDLGRRLALTVRRKNRH